MWTQTSSPCAGARSITENPSPFTRSEGYVDRWIVYGKVFADGHKTGEQLFTAKELTVEPGVKCPIKDNGADGLVGVQGSGKINGQPLNSPKLIRFTELTEDEYFCTEDGANAGVWWPSARTSRTPARPNRSSASATSAPK